jgi:hypothetical protein
MNKPLTLIATAAIAAMLAACSSAADDTTATSPATTSTPSDTAAPATTTEPATGDGTPITLTAGDVVITATLNDSQVSQDFAATLPTTLPWFRNSGIEYISELPAPLTETGPFYTDVQPGDIVYYNPADSITIIYEETSSVPTLTEMGEITSDLSVFDGLPDTVDMRVELG